MIRLVVAAVLLTLSGNVAFASALTCKSYRARLEPSLRRAKDLPTLEMAQGRESRTNPHTTYGVSFGTGLTGNLECFEADRLQEVDFSADLKDLSAKDAAGRIGQLQTLAVAAACSAMTDPDVACRTRTVALFVKAHRQLAQVTSRGDPLPAADESSDLSSRVTLDLFEKPDAMQFSMFIKEPSSDE